MVTNVEETEHVPSNFVLIMAINAREGGRGHGATANWGAGM